MNRDTRLSDLKKGQTATVSGLRAEGSMRRRLQDIGLIQGTRVECVGISPLGDPAAYLIRGAVIALRNRDAGCIAVENASSSFPARGFSPAVRAGHRNFSAARAGRSVETAGE